MRPASPRGELRQRVGAASESHANGPSRPRRRSSNANPQGSMRLARAGTAPREGKALKGDSRDASGMEQGRETPGRLGTQGTPHRVLSSWRSQNRREGTNPEDGSGEGVATLTHQRLLSSECSWVESGEAGRPEQCVQGARSSGEANPAGENAPRRVSERCGDRMRVATRRRNSGEEPTPREDDPGTRVPGTRSGEEHPAAARAARGAPQAKQGATRRIGASEGEREPHERQAARG